MTAQRVSEPRPLPAGGVSEECGVCDCGAPARRRVLTGALAGLAARLPFRCDACAELATRKLRAQFAELEAREREQELRRALDVTLPRLVRGARLDSIVADAGNRRALAAARRWAGGELAGLVLSGDVGRGKTWIAAAALAERLRLTPRRPARWVTATLLSEDAPAGLIGGGAVVLDDIGQVRSTAFGGERLWTAVELATSRRRPLLVTVNLRPSELEARWPESRTGASVVSRLLGHCEWHVVCGPDRRLVR